MSQNELQKRKRGRPLLMDEAMDQFSIRLPRSLIADADKRATERSVSRNEQVRHWIEAGRDADKRKRK